MCNMYKKLLCGVSACGGKAQGIVQIVSSEKDFASFKKCCVLVVSETNPSFTLLMLKAVAVVTEYGGVCSHAAIVSREIGVPCIVGAENATRLLKNGQKVFLDADEGVVYSVD